MKSDRFLIRGNFHEGNFGDDALLVTVHLLFSELSRQIEYDCEQIAYTRDVTQEVKLADERSLFCSDYLVYGGGTQFFSFGPTVPSQDVRNPLLSRILGLLLNFRRIFLSLRARLRYRRELQLTQLAIGAGFGPFVDDSSEKKTALSLVSKMDFVWVRDAASERFCSDAGVRGCVRGADLCFTSIFQDYLKGELAAIAHSAKNTIPRLGIILRDWEHRDIEGSYSTYTDLAERCRAQGMSVRFYIFSSHDKKSLKHLATCGEDSHIWNPDTMSIAEYSQELASCDSLLTARFHGAIFAILLNIPYTTITLEPKLEMVGNLLGEDATLDPGRDIEDYVKRIKQTLEQRDSIKARLRHVLAEQQQLGNAAVDGLRSYLTP